MFLQIRLWRQWRSFLNINEFSKSYKNLCYRCVFCQINFYIIFLFTVYFFSIMKTLRFHLNSVKTCSQNVDTSFIFLHRYKKHGVIFMYLIDNRSFFFLYINESLPAFFHFRHVNYQLFLQYCVSLINKVILDTIFFV
jgi:hypothetical protein